MTTGLPMEDEAPDLEVETLKTEVEKWKNVARAATLYIPEPERTGVRRLYGLDAVDQFGGDDPRG
jgi:hypothetical protein